MQRHLASALLFACLFACNAAPRSDWNGPAGSSASSEKTTAQFRADAASSKRAYEIADYYRTAFVGAPALSPDGRFLAFDLRRYDLEGGKSWSEIWRISPDGSGLRQMTQGRNNDTAPSFSPDGSTLLFVSTRGGASQLWSMPIDGGDAQQLTHFPPGVSDPLWSPDGRHIAVTASVWPECGADGECNRKLDDQLEKSALSVHVADELLYRHWTGWADGRRNHVLLVDAASGDVLRDLTPGDWDSPIFSLGGRGYDFSPDSRELCFVSNRDADQAGSTNADLWVVPIANEGKSEGEVAARSLTAANRGWDGAPSYSPDGRYLAWLSQSTPGYESDLKRIAIQERATGATRYLTGRGDFDQMIDDLRWSPDGSSLLFQAEVEGRTPIHRIAAAGGEVEVLHTDAFIGGYELLADGGGLVYSKRAVGSPPELHSVALGGGAPRQLTEFNAALEAEVDIRPVQELWVEGDGGHPVHVFLVTPHGFDPSRRYPLILNVHGGPQSQWADAYRGDWQVYPGKGYVVAFANPTGSTGYGQDFVDGISRDWGGRVFRDLMKVTDALEELPFVDRERMGAMGWSYGGYMMMWFQGHTDRFRCQAAMMGLYDLEAFWGSTEELWFPDHDLGGAPWESEDYRRWSPSDSVEEFRTPALVITGELDYRVPYTQSLQYFSALQRRGVPSKLVVFPGAGHWPAWHEMVFYYAAHLDWFHRWLGGEPSPWDLAELARGRRVAPGS